MGLDNGINIKCRDIDLPYFKDYKWLADNGESEVCYWRKFWGFRNDVVNHFGQEEECADIELDADKITELIEILEKYLERKFYNNYGDSIWDYEDYLIHNIQCLKNLKCVREYLKIHPDVRCYFYDSY